MAIAATPDLSLVGMLVVKKSGRTALVCQITPDLVIGAGTLMSELAGNPEHVVSGEVNFYGEPLIRRVTAAFVRYDSSSGLGVLRLDAPGPPSRHKFSSETPAPESSCVMVAPSGPGYEDSPPPLATVPIVFRGFDTRAGSLLFTTDTTVGGDAAGAPVFSEDRVIAIVSEVRATDSGSQIAAIPSTAIFRAIEQVARVRSSAQAPLRRGKSAPSPSQQKPEPSPEPEATLRDDLFHRLSISSHRALDHADGMRRAMGQDTVHMQHLLLALYEKDNGPTQRELHRVGLQESTLREQLARIVEAEMPAYGSYEVVELHAIPPLSRHARAALAAADEKATSLHSPEVQSRHLFYGALSVRDCRVIKWMFEREPAVDPARIDMTVESSRPRRRTRPVPSGDAALDVLVERRAQVAPDLPDGDDLLDIRREVDAISSVIAAHDTAPPLSIGLFGDWGTGKSFFMNCMEKHIEDLKTLARAKPTSAYCRNIVQLRFNAWHYMDTDLWASLAAEIFEGLARALEKDKGLLDGVTDDPAVARARLLAATSHLRDVRAKAEQRKAEADAALRESQERLTTLAQEEREIVARLSPRQLAKAAYRFVAGQERTAQSLDEAAKRLGIPEGKALAADTRATLLELKGLAGGIKAVWLSLRTGSAPLWGALLATLLLTSGAIALLVWYADQIGPKVGAAVMLLASAVGFAKKVIGPARQALAVVNSARAASQTTIDEVRQERETELKQAHKAIQERANAEDAAIARTTQEIAALEQQLEALRADRRMADFVRSKQESTDYTKHFGVIARARGDFQQLTDLITRVIKDKGAPADDGQPPIPRIDRIILYIDDLDRCPEAKVVDVLQAVHLLLAFPLFIVVVGVDSRWLLHSLRQHASVFKAQLDEDDGMDEEERVHWQSTPFNYLEKIFQIPFNLRPMEQRGFKALIDDLTIPKKKPGEDEKKAAAPQTPAPAVTPGPGSAPAPALTAAAGEVSPRDTGAVATTEPSQAQQPSQGQQPSQPPPQAPTPQTPAPQPHRMPAKKPLEPNPPFLDMTDVERLFMHRMYRLIPTPRAVKRYVNVYRLLRASLPDVRRRELEDDIQGDCRPVLLMLAILTGFPQEGTVILRELIERAPRGSWWAFIETLAKENIDAARAPRPERPAPQRATKAPGRAEPPSNGGGDTQRRIEERQRAQRWEDLMERLARVRKELRDELGDDPACDDFSRWARQVARYSFEAGRIIGLEEVDDPARRAAAPNRS